MINIIGLTSVKPTHDQNDLKKPNNEQPIGKTKINQSIINID
jgi:hypothetical protein